MKIWVFTDPHLGHDKLRKEKYRPEDFEDIIWNNIESNVKIDDLLICLGDFSFYNDHYWHYTFCGYFKFKKWLILGNHDRRTIKWYLNAGWDFVGDQIIINRYGLKILLSHMPQPDLDYFDVNLHGHLHDNEIRFNQNSDILTDKHILMSIEEDLSPKPLQYLVRK